MIVSDREYVKSKYNLRMIKEVSFLSIIDYIILIYVVGKDGLCTCTWCRLRTFSSEESQTETLDGHVSPAWLDMADW
jgi:hypothetical protein